MNSEVAIYSPNVSGVIGRLMIDPFTLLLTSTNARDYQAIVLFFVCVNELLINPRITN